MFIPGCNYSVTWLTELWFHPLNSMPWHGWRVPELPLAIPRRHRSRHDPLAMPSWVAKRWNSKPLPGQVAGRFPTASLV